MSKVLNNQVLKFEITEDRIKMEITLEDLEFLLKDRIITRRIYIQKSNFENVT